MANAAPAITIKAERRTAHGKQLRPLRADGKLPAVLYGHGVKNIDLLLDYHFFENTYRKVSASLIDLQIGDEKPVKVLIQEVQRHPVSDKYLHVDFHQVKMTEKIHTEITLKFIGESKAVKEAGGVLIKTLDTLKVECLPQDLVQEITVDITPLATFDDIIRIGDLALPHGIVAKETADTVVVSVQPPRTEEELKELEEKVEEKVEEVAVAGKKEGAEEAAAEGEAPAEGDKKAKPAKDEKTSK